MIVTHYTPVYRDSFLALLEEMRIYETAAFDNYLLANDSYTSNYLTAKDHIVLIALKGDQVIGFMVGSHTTNYIVSVVVLYEAKAERSKGVAFKLKTTLEDLCRMRGYKQIVSQVRTINTFSIALNNKAGWFCEMDKIYPDYYYWFTKTL